MNHNLSRRRFVLLSTAAAAGFWIQFGDLMDGVFEDFGIGYSDFSSDLIVVLFGKFIKAVLKNPNSNFYRFVFFGPPLQLQQQTLFQVSGPDTGRRRSRSRGRFGMRA